MTDKKAIILYQAYGAGYSYHQAIFSILTLYHQLQGNFGEVTVVVYTDKPGLFEKYAAAMPLYTELLTPNTLREFRGEQDFVHRAKICVIRNCFQKYQKDILYLDGDTYFTQSPGSLLQKISQGVSIMNENNYDLLSAGDFEEVNWLLIRKVIRDYQYSIEGQMVQIPLTTRMWNAGVIGMNYRYAPFIEQVLALSDQIYANYPVFTAEQFAFSYVLQNNTPLEPSGDVIFHYWPRHLKKLYNYHFRKFFRQHQQKPVKEQAQEAYQLTLRHHSLKFPEKTLLDRVLHRLRLIAQVTTKGRIRDEG